MMLEGSKKQQDYIWLNIFFSSQVNIAHCMAWNFGKGIEKSSETCKKDQSNVLLVSHPQAGVELLLSEVGSFPLENLCMNLDFAMRGVTLMGLGFIMCEMGIIIISTSLSYSKSHIRVDLKYLG